MARECDANVAFACDECDFFVWYGRDARTSRGADAINARTTRQTRTTKNVDAIRTRELSKHSHNAIY